MAVSLRHLISGLLRRALVWVGATAVCAANEFTVLAGGDADWTGMAYQETATKAVPLDFAFQRRSTAQKAAGESLVFTREKPDPATGLVHRIPVARVGWPAGVRQALLVFVPRTAPHADGLEFDVLAIDDGEKAFPAETLRVLNLTPVTLLGRVGTRDAEFAAGLSPLVRLADAAEKNAPAIPLALGVRTEQGPLTLYLAPLEVRPQARVLVLALPPKIAGSRKLRVFTVSQTVAPVAVR